MPNCMRLFQVVKALTASDTAYSATSSKGTTDSNILAGKDATLVALVQVSFEPLLMPWAAYDAFWQRPLSLFLFLLMHNWRCVYCIGACKHWLLLLS